MLRILTIFTIVNLSTTSQDEARVLKHLKVWLLYLINFLSDRQKTEKVKIWIIWKYSNCICITSICISPRVKVICACYCTIKTWRFIFLLGYWCKIVTLLVLLRHVSYYDEPNMCTFWHQPPGKWSFKSSYTWLTVYYLSNFSGKWPNIHFMKCTIFIVCNKLKSW